MLTSPSHLTRSLLCAAMAILTIASVPTGTPLVAQGDANQVVPLERLQGSEMAHGRRLARRARHRVCRRAPAAAHLLPGRHRRRRVEDRGRGHHVVPGRRRPDHDRLDRLDRRRAVESRITSGSAPAAPRFARTSSSAAASSSRPTRARASSSSGLKESGQIGGLRVHPTNPDIVWVAALGLAVRAERRARHLQDRATAARPGRRRSSSTTSTAAATSRSTGRTRTSCTPRCIAASARAGTSSAAARPTRAASTSRSTAARRGRRSPPACRRS